MKEWATKWGPWLGPSAVVAVLAVLSRTDACTAARVQEAHVVTANEARKANHAHVCSVRGKA